jgi:hypothetical protein
MRDDVVVGEAVEEGTGGSDVAIVWWCPVREFGRGMYRVVEP